MAATATTPARPRGTGEGERVETGEGGGRRGGTRGHPSGRGMASLRPARMEARMEGHAPHESRREIASIADTGQNGRLRVKRSHASNITEKQVALMKLFKSGDLFSPNKMCHRDRQTTLDRLGLIERRCRRCSNVRSILGQACHGTRHSGRPRGAPKAAAQASGAQNTGLRRYHAGGVPRDQTCCGPAGEESGHVSYVRQEPSPPGGGDGPAGRPNTGRARSAACSGG